MANSRGDARVHVTPKTVHHPGICVMARTALLWCCVCALCLGSLQPWLTQGWRLQRHSVHAWMSHVRIELPKPSSKQASLALGLRRPAVTCQRCSEWWAMWLSLRIVLRVTHYSKGLSIWGHHMTLDPTALRECAGVPVLLWVTSKLPITRMSTGSDAQPPGGVMCCSEWVANSFGMSPPETYHLVQPASAAPCQRCSNYKFSSFCLHFYFYWFLLDINELTLPESNGKSSL